ncbi:MULTISPECIES: chloramphenicol phosphotransferase CPT [Streptomyces]|uniref:chloramphenicol phosphotransferase CPT n=1 Tax=Streptomyces TaxID=1883 RepID=UPI000DDBF278|nr:MULTISPECIES: chloramphenicol phosphotransferase CPT [Streptomyces]MDX3385105.1 chloramphenicol phosphotransferase CPT [Streptomyces niveiscabiei]QZZ28551.1 chloramphenicol phosphotransferase CPT [Streptomyces sp. ST1015]
MGTRVVFLNGGSSSGKSGIVRCLQEILPGAWMAFGVDSFVEALPRRMQNSEEGILFEADGSIRVGAEFKAAEAAWREGVAAVARAGGRVIVDDVLLGGADGQRGWEKVFDGVDVLWVGVRCDAQVAAGREIARGDRVPGMAVSQAEAAHAGVRYDVVVDTSRTESLACARVIAERVRG